MALQIQYEYCFALPGYKAGSQLAYLTVPSTWSTTATEYIVSDSITGDLGKYNIKLPTAKDGISVNVGTEYREEKFNFEPDYIFANGLTGGGAPSPYRPCPATE